MRRSPIWKVHLVIVSLVLFSVTLGLNQDEAVEVVQ